MCGFEGTFDFETDAGVGVAAGVVAVSGGTVDVALQDALRDAAGQLDASQVGRDGGTSAEVLLGALAHDPGSASEVPVLPSKAPELSSS